MHIVKFYMQIQLTKNCRQEIPGDNSIFILSYLDFIKISLLLL